MLKDQNEPTGLGPSFLRRPHRGRSGDRRRDYQRTKPSARRKDITAIGTRGSGMSNNLALGNFRLSYGPDAGETSFTTRPEIVGAFGVVASTHWLGTAA